MNTACIGCDQLTRIVGYTERQAQACHDLLARIGILEYTSHTRQPGDPT